MGSQKVLLPYGGTTVVEHIAHVLEEGGVDQVIVVTGHKGQRVASALVNSRAKIAFNEAYPTGMLSSVRCGIRSASADTQAFLIALGDQPSIQTAVIENLITVFRSYASDSAIILVPTHGGRRGHPMLFSRHLRDQVLTRFDTEGLRGLLVANPDLVQEIPMEHRSILCDMDYPGDYAKQLDALEKRGLGQ